MAPPSLHVHWLRESAAGGSTASGADVAALADDDAGADGAGGDGTEGVTTHGLLEGCFALGRLRGFFSAVAASYPWHGHGPSLPSGARSERATTHRRALGAPTRVDRRQSELTGLPNAYGVSCRVRRRKSPIRASAEYTPELVPPFPAGRPRFST